MNEKAYRGIDCKRIGGRESPQKVHARVDGSGVAVIGQGVLDEVIIATGITWIIAISMVIHPIRPAMSG